MAQPFKQLKAWRALKRKPGMTRSELTVALGWKNEAAVSNLLVRLRQAGCARKEGLTWGARWYATDKRPADERGHNEASLQNLKAQQKVWQQNLVKAAQARGLHLRRYPHKRAKPAIALESAWGFLPFSGEVARAQAPGQQSACEVASRENEAA